MQSIDAIEQRLIELCAEACLEVDAGLRDPPPLAPCLLALFRGEGAEILLEARVAAVGPVKLAVAP